MGYSKHTELCLLYNPLVVLNLVCNNTIVSVFQTLDYNPTKLIRPKDQAHNKGDGFS